ncbi:MAG: hypothetical protein ACTSUE_05190 [Promethearchaeota archaeon]
MALFGENHSGFDLETAKATQRAARRVCLLGSWTATMLDLWKVNLWVI